MTACVRTYLEYPLSEHHHSDRCARLGVAAALVSGLRQEVIDSKTLPLADGPDAAREVHLLVDHVVPQPLQRRQVFRPERLRVENSQVGYGSEQVHGPDRVALDGLLLNDRLVCLVVPLHWGITVSDCVCE